MKTNGLIENCVVGPLCCLEIMKHFTFLITNMGEVRVWFFWCCHRYATVPNNVGDFHNMSCSSLVFMFTFFDKDHLHLHCVVYACSIFELAVCCMLGILYVGRLTNGILVLKYVYTEITTLL
jgi:hypothetical protein